MKKKFVIYDPETCKYYATYRTIGGIKTKSSYEFEFTKGFFNTYRPCLFDYKHEVKREILFILQNSDYKILEIKTIYIKKS